LSIINWIASVFNIGYSFVVGPGVTLVIDANTQVVMEDRMQDSRTILTVINFVARVGLADKYTLFGFLPASGLPGHSLLAVSCTSWLPDYSCGQRITCRWSFMF
jgi:hypothetical protein